VCQGEILPLSHGVFYTLNIILIKFYLTPEFRIALLHHETPVDVCQGEILPLSLEHFYTLNIILIKFYLTPEFRIALLHHETPVDVCQGEILPLSLEYFYTLNINIFYVNYYLFNSGVLDSSSPPRNSG
jgi:hypothetical protein